MLLRFNKFSIKTSRLNVYQFIFHNIFEFIKKFTNKSKVYYY